jgi:alpha-methylacyl-CoA racemase
MIRSPVQPNRMNALEHITILDLTRLLPGAVATQMLASYGARVIKIEQPGLGDYARHGFGANGVNPLFLETNRNKQSVVLDLKHPEGKAILRKLAERADLVVESFRPGVMDRLELGYAALSTINPRLIYVALTGYGQAGQYAQMAGHDLNYLAMAGVLNEIGSPERPSMGIASSGHWSLDGDRGEAPHRRWPVRRCVDDGWRHRAAACAV